MIANILRFTTGDVGVTLSGLFGLWLAVLSHDSGLMVVVVLAIVLVVLVLRAFAHGVVLMGSN